MIYVLVLNLKFKKNCKFFCCLKEFGLIKEFAERLKIHKQGQFRRNSFISRGFFSACCRSGHAFIFPLKRSLDQEDAVCLRQESNLASGKCCRGLLLKLTLAWRKSKNRAVPVSSTRDFFIARIIGCSEEFEKL